MILLEINPVSPPCPAIAPASLCKFSVDILQMFISGGGVSDVYAVMARTGGPGQILLINTVFIVSYEDLLTS